MRHAHWFFEASGCAEARANPAGHVAQVMLASGQPDLHYGGWIHKL